MSKDKCVRLRVIRPVFEELVISDEMFQYFYCSSFKNSKDIYSLFKHLSKESREHFIALHLDSKNKIVCIDRVSIGTLSSSIVHPREVFKSALLSSCASIAFVHNHPSGDPEPSKDDLIITRKLQEAGKIIGIQVLDHIIIGNGSYISLMEKGYIQN